MKTAQLMDEELNKSNLEMTTDYFNIKYHRPMTALCIKNKANETKLTVTKVMMWTMFIQTSKKWAGKEIYAPAPVTWNSPLAQQLMSKI